MPNDRAAFEAVYFYDPVEGEYGFLSNYFEAGIAFNDRRYPSSEHAYQAAKAADRGMHDWLAASPTPQLAAVAGDALTAEQSRADWLAIRVPLMRQILRAKFTQHRDLLARLLATGERRLAELASGPSEANLFWSEVDGAGDNMLGRLLMELRSDLRNANHDIASMDRKADKGS